MRAMAKSLGGVARGSGISPSLSFHRPYIYIYCICITVYICIYIYIWMVE